MISDIPEDGWDMITQVASPIMEMSRLLPEILSAMDGTSLPPPLGHFIYLLLIPVHLFWFAGKNCCPAWVWWDILTMPNHCWHKLKQNVCQSKLPPAASSFCMFIWELLVRWSEAGGAYVGAASALFCACPSIWPEADFSMGWWHIIAFQMPETGGFPKLLVAQLLHGSCAKLAD